MWSIKVALFWTVFTIAIGWDQLHLWPYNMVLFWTCGFHSRQVEGTKAKRESKFYYGYMYKYIDQDMEAAKSQGMISLENGLSFEGKTAMEPMESKFERSQIIFDLDEMH